MNTVIFLQLLVRMLLCSQTFVTRAACLHDR